MWRVLLLWPSIALAQGVGDFGYKHQENHGWYDKLKGGACCHGGDCRETLARYTASGWEALVDGLWHKIPDSQILPDKTRDGKAHVCAGKTTKTIFCFIEPMVEG